MARIAIDIALLPPKEVMDIIINISRKADEKGNVEHLMSEEDFIPHISLCMGCAEESDIEKISNIVSNIANKFSPLKLKVSKLSYVTSSEGKKTYYFQIREN